MGKVMLTMFKGSQEAATKGSRDTAPPPSDPGLSVIGRSTAPSPPQKEGSEAMLPGSAHPTRPGSATLPSGPVDLSSDSNHRDQLTQSTRERKKNP
jgi:hypothetical protein